MACLSLAGDKPVAPSTPGKEEKALLAGAGLQQGGQGLQPAQGLSLLSPSPSLLVSALSPCPAPPAEDESCLPLRHLVTLQAAWPSCCQLHLHRTASTGPSGRTQQSHFLGAHPAPTSPRVSETGGCNNSAVNNCGSLTMASLPAVCSCSASSSSRIPSQGRSCHEVPGFQPAFQPAPAQLPGVPNPSHPRAHSEMFLPPAAGLAFVYHFPPSRAPMSQGHTKKTQPHQMEDLLPGDRQHCLNTAQHKGLTELLLLLIPAPLPQSCLEQSLPL